MEPALDLFPFQEEGIRFASEREGALIADEMGLGKTCQAIGVINEDPTIRKVIVVCPASVRIPWRREFERWLNRPLSIAVVGVDVGFIQTLFSKDVLIINWDRLSRFTKELSVSTYDLLCPGRVPLCQVAGGSTNESGSRDQGPSSDCSIGNAHSQSSDRDLSGLELALALGVAGKAIGSRSPPVTAELVTINLDGM